MGGGGGGGGAERGLTGKLAVQGIRGTLALAHTHAFIPLFTLDQPLAALFLSGQAPFHLSQMSSLHCLHFSVHAFFFFLLISLIEQRWFLTIHLSAAKSTSAYLSFSPGDSSQSQSSG